MGSFSKLLPVLGCLVLGACAQQSSSTFGSSEATYAGQSLASGIEEGATGFGPVNSGTGADASCVTLSGNTVDADGDSIPLNATLTFNCTAIQSGYTGMLTGTETVIDTQPNAVAWAFSATADLHGQLTAPGGATLTQDRSGQFVASQTSTVGPFQLQRMLDATTVFKGPEGRTLATVDEHNGWTIAYTPTATWTPGGVVIGGTIGVTGSWMVSVNNASVTATLATSTPLILTPSCATRITGGTVTAGYDYQGHGNTITVKWTACGQSTVTYAPTSPAAS